MIVAGREEHDLFRLRGFDHLPGVGADARAPREHAEIERFEHREGVVRPLDEQHRLPGLDFVSIIERVDDQLIPPLGAEFQNRNRFIDAAEIGVGFAEHLHRHPRAMPVFAQEFARCHKAVGVVNFKGLGHERHVSIIGDKIFADSLHCPTAGFDQFSRLHPLV